MDLNISQEDTVKVLTIYAEIIVMLCERFEDPDLKPLNDAELAFISLIKDQAGIIVRANNIAKGN